MHSKDTLMKHLIPLFLLFLCISKVSEKTPVAFEGKVTAVKDGDTFKVLADGKEITIRLAHVDCPERKQPFSNNAKQLASDLCFGKMVKIVSDGTTDRYKRLVAEVYVGKQCVNQQLVQNGLAWHFKKYSKNRLYADLEVVARKNKVGLWADPESIAPWEWRKKSKQKKLKPY
jgi:micrococcal nuclease